MLKAISYLIEILSWVKIALSPTLIGGLIGVIIYINSPNLIGLIISIFIGSAGLVLGIIWASRIWKKEGTTYFMSRVDASPDLDEARMPKKIE